MDEDLEFDPFIDPDSRWGNPDYRPDAYNDHFQAIGSQFVAYPEHIENGLDRDLGEGAARLLEDEDKANIADLLVDKEVWRSQAVDIANARAGNGWYTIDFRRPGDDKNYQGFLRPVENLGWDVVMQKYDNETGAPSAGTAGIDKEIQVQSPSLNAQISEEPDAGDYYGHFMPSMT